MVGRLASIPRISRVRCRDLHFLYLLRALSGTTFGCVPTGALRPSVGRGARTWRASLLWSLGCGGLRMGRGWLLIQPNCRRAVGSEPRPCPLPLRGAPLRGWPLPVLCIAPSPAGSPRTGGEGRSAQAASVGRGAVDGSPRGRGRSTRVAPWARAQYAGRSVGTGVVRGSLRGHGRSARVAPWAGAQCAGPLWAAALWALAHGRGRWATLGGSVASRLMCRLSLGSSAVRRAPSCAGSQCAASLRRSLHCAAPRRAWSRSTQRPSLAPVPRGRGALAVRAIGSGCSGVPRTGRFQRKGAGVGLEPATFSI